MNLPLQKLYLITSIFTLQYMPLQSADATKNKDFTSTLFADYASQDKIAARLMQSRKEMWGWLLELYRPEKPKPCQDGLLCEPANTLKRFAYESELREYQKLVKRKDEDLLRPAPSTLKELQEKYIETDTLVSYYNGLVRAKNAAQS